MPRKVRVVTTCKLDVRKKTMDENREHMLGILDFACTQKPDIVCLPENFVSVGIAGPLSEKAEPVPGPTVDACAKRAREHRTYVVCPLTTVRDGRFFNSAVFIDRDGEVCGIYDKVQPVTSTPDFSKVESGMTPGVEAQTFELDFGTVGCQICFDISYPDTWQQLADRGAELVFWPSAYDGGFPLRAYAYLYNYYVVSSVRTTHLRMIDPLGNVVAENGRGESILSREIDLDYIVCHGDFHAGIYDEMRAKYGPDVTIKRCREEGRWMAESNSDDVPLSQMIEEFGLGSCRDYLGRHLPAFEALRAGHQPEPQVTPYLDREAYEPRKKQKDQQPDQMEIVESFGTVDYDPDYDYKAERKRT
jgi:beta-ureidopropionase